MGLRDFIFGRPKVESISIPRPPSGFGAPLHIAYGYREPPDTGGAARYAYLTELQPRYTPIGGGIPNQRDIGCSPPSWSKQAIGLAVLGSPGILAGSFVSGPLTNTSSPGGGDFNAGSVPGEFELPPL